MSIWLFLVHWLHIIGAAVWFGGTVIGYFVLFPGLLTRPVPEARATFLSIQKFMAPVMGTAAQLVVWLGIIRATWFGPIDSWADVTGTPYGHAFLGAIVLTVAFAVYGATTSRKFEARVWDGDTIRPTARAFVRNGGITSVLILGAVIALMVRMRFGL